MKRPLQKLCFLVAAVFLIPLTTQADNGSDLEFDERHPLVYEDAWDLWPYAFLNEKGEPVGYNVDLLTMIFKRLDIPFTIHLKPTNEALRDLKEGRSDLMLGMDAHFHDEFAFYGRTVVHLFTHSVVHQKGSPATIKTVSDLSRHRVIVHEGSFSHHLMIERGWERNAEGFNDMKEAIQAASLDPTREIVWNTMSLKWLIHKFQISNLELSPVDIPHGEYKFMSNNRQLLVKMDSIYARLNAEEKLQPLQNKWFYPEIKESGIPDWVWKIAAAVAFLVLCSLVYYLFYHYREKKLTKDLRKTNDRLALILQTSGTRIWTYDTRTKTFTWMDENAQPLEDYTPLDISRQYQKDDIEQAFEAMDRLIEGSEERLSVELRGSKDGQPRDYVMSMAVFHRDKNGKPLVLIGTRNDITEEKQQQRRSKDIMLRYQAIFDTVMVGMAFYDENGVMTAVNEKAASTFHTTPEAVIGQHLTIADILGTDDIDLDHFETMHFTRIANQADNEQAFKKPESKGKEFFEMQLTPVYNNSHKLLGIYGTGREVTEVADSYNRLQQNMKKLEAANKEVTDYIQNINFAMKVGGIRLVNYSPTTHMLTIFDEIGHPAYELTQARAFMLVCEKDKPKAHHILNSMDNGTASPVNLTVQATIRVKQDRPLCLQFHFVPIINADGTPDNYIGMCRDVSELRQTERELEKETIKAQEVEVVKDAFLRNMSYEIRTPLNTVVGFAELFELPHSLEDEAVFVSEIKSNSRELLKLINNILFLSRLDAHMIEIKPQPVDYAQMFEGSCTNSWAGLQQPGVSYVVENPYQQLVVDIDAQNVGVILEQIIANACQNTTSGSVRARIDYIGDQLVLAVDDTGCGITEDFLPSIFDRFTTGANSGTGLGLSICHELVTQMGGTINIKSTVGKGTTVWVALPCKATEIVRK